MPVEMVKLSPPRFTPLELTTSSQEGVVYHVPLGKCLTVKDKIQKNRFKNRFELIPVESRRLSQNSTSPTVGNGLSKFP